jgi:hypothetical protein
MTRTISAIGDSARHSFVNRLYEKRDRQRAEAITSHLRPRPPDSLYSILQTSRAHLNYGRAEPIRVRCDLVRKVGALRAAVSQRGDGSGAKCYDGA